MIDSNKKTNEDALLKLYSVKLQEVIELKELNEKLLDDTKNLVIRIIQVCKKNNIPIDAETKAMISRVRKTLHEIQYPLASDHPQMNTQKETHKDGTECTLKDVNL